MTDALDGFDERSKERKLSSPDFPAVTINQDQTTCGLLLPLREALGDPEHAKFLFNEPQLAIVPCDEDDPNAYVVSHASVTIGWLKTEWGWVPEPGRYRASVEDGVAVIDFSEGRIAE